MKKVMLSAAVCAMAFSANADVADEVVIAEAIQASAFDSIYAGLGIGGSFLTGDEIGYPTKADDADDQKIKDGAVDGQKPKANRFIGSFVLGGGKVFNNKIYGGLEFLMDFTKNKKHNVTGVVDTNATAAYKYENGAYEAKIGGFIPQISAKLGYAFNKCTLAYLKLGCAWTKLTYTSFKGDATTGFTELGSGSKTKAAFVLGLGAEKAFCKKFSVAVEGDYNFGWKMDAPIAELNTTKDDLIVKNNRFNKGWTVRALVKYNVKY